MKRNRIKSTLIVVSLVLGVLGIGKSGFSSIAGSKHDFSSQSWSGGQICIVCHTPHNANTSVTNAPLWNHTLTNAVYTLYNSATLNAVPGQPNGISKLCLSCHDGTVAVDSYGARTGTSTIAATANFGTNLSNDHPISFAYDAALAAADGGLYDPTVRASGLSGSSGTIGADMLFSGRVECASCHDVHNARNLTGLLVKSNAASALCLTCHNK